MATFQPAAVQWITDVTVIADLPPFLQHFGYQLNGDNVSNDSLDLGRDEAKATIHLKYIEFPLLKFANMMGQHNHSVYNKWNTV